MNEIECYQLELDKAFNYLEKTAEDNGFYGPLRQKVCTVIWIDKDNSLKNLEKAIKYLERRLTEQDMEELLEHEICKKVFNNNFWIKRWPTNIMVLAHGEEVMKPEVMKPQVMK